MSAENYVDVDIYGTEYGPYHFWCEPLADSDNSLLLKDAWGHEFIINGFTYNCYEDWLDAILEAIDDDEFVENNEDYLDELQKYEEIVYEVKYGIILIEDFRPRLM